MPLIVPPGFAQVAFTFQWGGDPDPMISTLGFDISSFPDGEITVADALFDVWESSILNQQTNNLFLSEVVAYVGQEGGGPTTVIESTREAAQGNANSAPLPPNCAGLLRKRTGLAGRRGRGRMYIPGMAEGEVDANGFLGGTYKAALQAEAANFVLGLVIYELIPVVLHRSEGIGTEPPPTTITALVFDDRIATQRRRLRS